MKSIKFRSLTMRIWMTFNVIILTIICSISFIYLVAYKRLEENTKKQDLKVAHDILLKSNNFNQPLGRFAELKNLRDSGFFIFNISDNKRTNIIEVNKWKNQAGAPPPLNNINFNDIKMWMGSFIKEDDIFEQQFVKLYNNTKFIFIISSIDYEVPGKSYLISYVPEMRDNIFFYIVIIIGAVFISIGFLTAKIVANYLSKPLKKLENYTIKIANKEWVEPIEVKSDDEIGRLINSMNRMQKQLKRAEEEEKMFLQSISHDLKTPVMIIMGHAEAIIDGVYIESIEKTAEIIKEEAISLEKKIKQMLYLNTLEYFFENNEEKEEIDLHELVLSIVARFKVVNNEITWELEIDEMVIRGNSEKIQVAIENILDNEIRYAEKEVYVVLKEENGFAVLEIYNDGPNIDEKHINHIFDNFYKDNTGNFGLGLAISKKVINFYGGEISVINREKGVSFIIKLPKNSRQ